jgi:enamine deaminase RidA (YjgF/YER057c/UK114 family)
MREQTADVLAQIDELLAAAGTDKSRLLSATVYIADLALKPEMDAAWSRWIDPANPPTRATVEAKFAPRGALVEIVCSAAQ